MSSKEHEQYENIIKSPPFPIGEDAALASYAILKSCFKDQISLNNVRKDIELHDPMFLILTLSLRGVRERLHLNAEEKESYTIGSLYGYFASDFQHQTTGTTQPYLQPSDIDRYFTTLIKPDIKAETTPQFTEFNESLGREDAPFAFGHFVWLVNSCDKRNFVENLQQDFVKNSLTKLERFSEIEPVVTEIGLKRFVGDESLSGSTGLRMGIMDAILPFQYKYQAESMNNLLSGINITP